MPVFFHSAAFCLCPCPLRVCLCEMGNLSLESLAFYLNTATTTVDGDAAHTAFEKKGEEGIGREIAMGIKNCLKRPSSAPLLTFGAASIGHAFRVVSSHALGGN